MEVKNFIQEIVERQKKRSLSGDDVLEILEDNEENLEWKLRLKILEEL